jgi:hypothetical protein
MKKQNSYTLIAAAILMSFAACKSTSTSPNGGTTTITIPGTGSFFVTVSEDRDSTGMLMSSDTSTDVFQQTGLAIYGKTNVVQVVTMKDGIAMDTGYIHYESNGDVSSYAGSNGAVFPGQSGWMMFPFASQGTVSSTFDTTVSGFLLHGVITLKGAGSGSVTIHGKPFSTEKVNMTVTTSTNFGGQTISQTITATMQFAPELGDVVRTDQPSTRNPVNGAMEDANVQFVVDYLLK